MYLVRARYVPDSLSIPNRLSKGNAKAIATKCPEWCTSKEIEDHAEDGHDGPSWPCLPNNEGFNTVEISVQLPREGLLSVVVNAPIVKLAAEEASKVGLYLIEAGE